MSPCDYKQCLYLCLLRPTLSGGGVEAVCACPENHYLAKDGKNCIANCTSSQILCPASSKCIPFWWKCDNNTDCPDGSDEPPECGEYFCSESGLFQCSNATSAKDCLLPNQICDGKSQCPDDSDELNCDSYTCMEHYSKCQKDNLCIPNFKICDGHPDCSDKEDEKNCPVTECNASQFKCNNSRCVPYVWKCDNDDDCGDGSDEPENCKTSPCPKDFFKCNSTGRCIPESWKCDGDYDCNEQDTSDEDSEECHTQTCDPTFFRCKNGHCIPGRWRCDFHDDCRDGGSDEMDCVPHNCSSTEFKCNYGGKCIPKSLYCNDVFDCVDKSDEIGCKYECNSSTEFQCGKIKHCIPLKWKCDGETDCADGTDEMHCERNCTEKEFKCKNSQCKPKEWQCDGDDDCGDNSDEAESLCSNFTCPPDKFWCGEQKCIWPSMLCNHFKDCPDGRDENLNLCSLVYKCIKPNFLCKTLTQCVPPYKQCDGSKDCDDGSDEDPLHCANLTVSKLSDSCQTNNGGCEHHCVDTYFGPKCECKHSYVLNNDGATCSFDNPCHHFNTCSQKCDFEHGTGNDNELSAGKVSCSCVGSYKLLQRSCIAPGDEPQLLIAETGNVVLRTKLHSNQSLTKTPKLGDKNGMIISIDSDFANQLMFYINKTNNEHFLVKKSLSNMAAVDQRRKRDVSEQPNILHLQDRQLFEMGGLAVDWVSNYIYLTDLSNRQIYVYNYNGDRGKIVAKGNLRKPLAIAVDPIAGYIFWVDAGSGSKIERANLDGSERKTIVSSDMIWPSGIAVDTYGRWVYWTDVKKHTIEVARYDGSNRQVVFNAGEDAPKALDIFEDYIYILTNKNNMVFKINKIDRNVKPLTVFFTVNMASDINIVQKFKQQNANSNCTKDGVGKVCESSEICFNKPQDPRGYVCLCPDGSRKVGNKCDFQKQPTCVNYCRNNGKCEVMKVSGRPKCSCEIGFHGDQCEYNACHDYCLQGNCTLSGSKPTCTCNENFTGEKCDRFVCSGFCQNGGVCRPVNGKPVCYCQASFTGEKCQDRSQDWCSKVCRNGGVCNKERSGYITCNCPPGFTGKSCEQCTDLICSNKGICEKDPVTNKSKCNCPKGLNSSTNCQTSVNCALVCKLGAKLFPDMCDCSCPPPYNLCRLCFPECGRNYVCNNDDKDPQCVCDKIHSGPNCETCKCQPTGQCTLDPSGQPFCNCSMETFGPLCEYQCVGSCGPNAHCTMCHLNLTTHKGQCTPGMCVCNPGFQGSSCLSNSSAAVQDNSVPASSLPMVVIISIVVVIVISIVAVLIFLVIRRKKRRISQYGHKRMSDNNLNVTNPVYMRNNVEDEDECEPLSGGVIFTGANGNNFASAMYDMYSSDSTQKLLSPGAPDDELSVSYSINGHDKATLSTDTKTAVA
ncbi:Exosome complex protein [Bulinus truncatus]|nr:Exosome complex protein [Bulinus truncatus]